MNLTKETLLDRRKALENEFLRNTEKRDQAYSEASKLLANINGAVQDCDYWLGILDKEEKITAEEKATADTGKPSLVEMKPKAADAKA